MMTFAIGFFLIAISVGVMFFLDDDDPYQRLFPWAWKSLRLMFISGVVVMLVGWLMVIWRYLA